jgi:ATP synthase subunit 6
LVFVSFSSFFNIVPTTLFQRLFEYTIKFILNLIKQQIGLIGYQYVVLIFSIFFNILILNLLSLLPFGIALTSHLIIILYLSLSICLGIFFEGYIISGDQFLKIFLPKSPLIMLPLLLLIELFSYIIRMFSLAIRLVANIMAGHTLIYIISTFTLMITSMNFFFIIIGITLICIIMLLELGVACLQAYVFTILILIYINDIYGGSH